VVLLINSGIQGAFYDAGCKTVIPRKVIGKFSIRIVPNMEPAAVENLVINYLIIISAITTGWEFTISPKLKMSYIYSRLFIECHFRIGLHRVTVTGCLKYLHIRSEDEAI